jgi:hypothetical protein
MVYLVSPAPTSSRHADMGRSTLTLDRAKLSKYMRLIHKPETYTEASPDHHLVQVIEALAGISNQSTSPQNMPQVGRVFQSLRATY